MTSTISTFSTSKPHNNTDLLFNDNYNLTPSINTNKIMTNLNNVNVPTKRCNIPGIGVATQLSMGVIQIHYADGSKISIIPKDQGGGITYNNVGGIPTHFNIDYTSDQFNTNTQLPQLLKERLQHLPIIIKHLNMQSSTPVANNNNNDCIGRFFDTASPTLNNVPGRRYIR